MVDCPLPRTGSSTLVLVLLALALLGGGILLLRMARRLGFGGGVAVIVVLSVGAALTVSNASRADAASCPSSEVAPSTAAQVTSTTAAATTTTTAGATTTTTAPVPVPDLMPTIDGPRVGFSGRYTITITNVGSAPTTGPMTFSLTLAILEGPGPLIPSVVIAPDWTSVIDSSGVTFTSVGGLVIAPGATSVVSLLVEWRVDAPGTWQGTVTLPTGIGGETNGTNNTDSITVVIPPPPR